MDTLMLLILFLYLFLTDLQGCGEPISGIVSKCTWSLGLKECRLLGGSIAY